MGDVLAIDSGEFSIFIKSGEQCSQISFSRCVVYFEAFLISFLFYFLF